MRYTPLRLMVVEAMLANPDGQWTAREMKEIVAATGGTHGDVFETFFLLMSERLAEAVPFQNALTIRIRTDSAARRRLEQWREANAHPYRTATHPAKGGDRR